MMAGEAQGMSTLNADCLAKHGFSDTSVWNALGVAGNMINDHETASKVLSAAFEAFGILDHSIHDVIATGSPEEVTEYKRAVGSIMAEILFRILNPVIREHPDLAPDG